ncbi:hypothetical protein TIFTF001_033916 [Ficus carica]|uniref:Uncharacterized protein n=1 Tax=Ficus carica TaxID=3494 RepID=A0AA88E1M7_FICCA|nr:hypothetical protein TIFTF001_033916 [Ficus carica]
MSGIIHKIGEALHVGGPKAEDKHKAEHQGHGDEHKSGEHYKPEHHGEQKGEHKEGLVEKIKDKIHGGEGHEGKDGDKKKKKKEKKKHEDGHHHDSSSSSDSD